jgi:hypothetical protein
VCLGFVFLLATRVLAATRFSRRDAAWCTAEILLLQHQVTVLQRQLGERACPKVSWVGRALIALLLVSPCRARLLDFPLSTLVSWVGAGGLGSDLVLV